MDYNLLDIWFDTKDFVKFFYLLQIIFMLNKNETKRKIF
jgi:hypothetical protein